MGMKGRLGKADEVLKHAQWIVDNAAKGEHAPQALLVVAGTAFQKARKEDDLAAAKRAKKYLEQLIADHPNSRPGMMAKRAMSDVDEAIALIEEKKEAAAKEAEAKKDAGDESADKDSADKDSADKDSADKDSADKKSEKDAPKKEKEPAKSK